MKIKAGEVEETVKNIMNRYLTGREIEQNEFEYIKRYSRYLKNYKFIKRQGGKIKKSNSVWTLVQLIDL